MVHNQLVFILCGVMVSIKDDIMCQKSNNPQGLCPSRYLLLPFYSHVFCYWHNAHAHLILKGYFSLFGTATFEIKKIL